jgi:tungstate transport system substrate-binding protein
MPPAPVEVALTNEIAGSGLVQTLIGTFEHKSAVHVNLRIVDRDKAFALARDRVVQVVFTAEPEAVRHYAPVARLASPFAARDFAIAGPDRDPAVVRRAEGTSEALRAIAKRRARFCSAVDAADLRERELQLWASAGLDPSRLPRHADCHGSVLTALQHAAALKAYTLTDASAATAAGTKFDIKVLRRGPPDLHDVYSVILVDHVPRIRRDQDAEWLVQWVMSYQGRDAVQSYRLDGIQPFSVRAAQGK